MFSLTGFLKGLLIQDPVDRTKQLELSVSSSATTNTTTTLIAEQTADRTIYLPDGDATLVSEDGAQTLTNKTIDGDDNTIEDLALSSLKTELADANKVLARDASGIVTSQNLVPTSDLVGVSDAQTLTNKTIDGDNNTVQDLALSSLKTNLTDASKFLVRNASGVVISNTKAVPTGVVVGDSDSQTLTNKTIDGDNNTIQDLALSSLKTEVSDASKFIVRDGSGVVVSSSSSVPSSSVVGISDAQTLSNKTINNTNTVTISDSLFTIQDNTDATKQVKFEASSVTTGTTRTLTVPNANTTLVGTDNAQSLTNKTIDASLNTVSNITASMIDSEASSNGQVLTSDGAGGAAWANPGAGSTTVDEYYYKDYVEVRVTSTSNLTFSSAYDNGSTVDGVPLVTGNLILLTAQSVPSQNGIWVVPASGAPTVRGTGGTTISELTNAAVIATEGSANANIAWYQGVALASFDDQAWGINPAQITFTVPVGISELDILAVGGGGAGGNGGRVANPNTGSAAGGAGGNGAPIIETKLFVTSGDTVTIDLGRGGRRQSAASSSVAINGEDGFPTLITHNSTLLKFPGGAGGNGADGGTPSTATSNLASGYGGYVAVSGGAGGDVSAGDAGYNSLYNFGGAGGAASSTGAGGGGGASYGHGADGADGVSSATQNGLKGDDASNVGGAGGGGGSGARVAVSGSTRIGGGGGQGGTGYVRISY